MVEIDRGKGMREKHLLSTTWPSAYSDLSVFAMVVRVASSAKRQ